MIGWWSASRGHLREVAAVDIRSELVQHADNALPFRPVPARVIGPGSGIDPALMKRLQGQERPQ